MIIKREDYLETLSCCQDKDLIKVVIGIGRCGKSTLLGLLKNEY